MTSIPESALRAVWEAQQCTPPLITTDGRNVDVLDIGIRNNDAGPDFHDALIRIGGILYRGDVELHIDARSWTTHGHAYDDHYNGVILHVACRSAKFVTLTASGRTVPLLLLDFSPSSFEHALASTTLTPPVLQCYAWNQSIPLPIIRRWLRAVGRARLRNKAARVHERLKELAQIRKDSLCDPQAVVSAVAGIYQPEDRAFSREDFAVISLWEQLLYEGTMECLGYAKNRRPMLRLAQRLPLSFLRQYPLDEPQTTEAILFGASGLLPHHGSTDDEESRSYTAALHERWHAIRSEWREAPLHSAEWMFFRLRPVNFPTARLAILAALLPKLFGGRGFRRLIEIARTHHESIRGLVASFAALYDVRPSDYWQTRCSFGLGVNEGGTSLGTNRIHDILVNTLVPILFTYACVFDDRKVRLAAIQLHAGIPRLQENLVTERMGRELVRGRFAIRRAAEQQALLQLHNDFCLKGRCEECAVGRQVRQV